ncbi:MAG: ATP/GTP-binding protein [Methanobacteriota archaeon]
MINLYFVGTAGSGKTTLTHAFQLWMQQHGFNAITMNLDPGVDMLPYPADIDVREWVSIPEVMQRYGVGPNGAQIIAADLLAVKAKEIKEVLEEFEADYLLVDTPGQIELFTLRESSRFVLDVFDSKKSAIAFLFDPVLARMPAGFVSLLLLCTSTQFRFDIPIFNVLAKSDILSPEEVEKIVEWSKDSGKLYDALINTKPTMQTQASIELFYALERIEAYKSLIPISSKNNYGMEDLYNLAQQVFMGGEDLGKD